jgi:lipopolysaccharide transport system permease protein
LSPEFTPPMATITDRIAESLPQMADEPVARTKTVIEPRSEWQFVDWREVWRRRELLYFLVWRDIKVRYKQTTLGAAWALLQPLATMVVFTIVFGRFSGLAASTSVPYPVFVLAALLPWTFFSNGVSQAGQSLLTSSNLISKIYFPRVLVPLAPVIAGLLDLSISLLCLLVMMPWYGVRFSSTMPLAIFFLGGVLVATAAIGTLLSALVVVYRDVRHVVALVLQLWMFLSPVAYPLEVVPERWRLWYALNPMSGMIGGFRAAILGTPFDLPSIAISAASIVTLSVVAMIYFRTVERRLADII